MEQSKGLDGGTLKLIAAALMLTDHVGAILLPQVLILRCIGRLAFPVFAFSVAEGYTHTRDFRKYVLRMAVWAVVSEAPFNLENGLIFDLTRQNVLWTFCLALLTLRGLDRLRREPGAIGYAGAALALAAGFAAGELLHVDYGGWGVLLVTLFYLTREVRNRWAIQLVGLALFCWFCSAWRLEMLAMLSLIPLYLYNGERGFSNKALQYGFYAFYPVHILILSVLARYVF